MLKWSDWLNAFIHLFYPNLCAGCASDVLSENKILCVRCLVRLPKTNFATIPNNPVEKIFWGRINLVAAHSEFYFSKHSIIQTLVHQLKYNNGLEVGRLLGKMMGQSLMESQRFNRIDYLIPLPLFPDKQKKRGYNQAYVICQGISEIMQVPILEENLIRIKNTTTQTKKQRSQRWENVADSFIIKHPALLQHKHVLLVDDVVTTGATLEAGGRALLQITGLQLSIATLMIADKQ